MFLLQLCQHESCILFDCCATGRPSSVVMWGNRVGYVCDLCLALSLAQVYLAPFVSFSLFIIVQVAAEHFRHDTCWAGAHRDFHFWICVLQAQSNIDTPANGTYSAFRKYSHPLTTFCCVAA